MKSEWTNRFRLSSQLYFGDLYDFSLLNTYYFEDQKLIDRRDQIIGYLEDKLDNGPILIGGDAGVGKSTFINNLIKTKLDSQKFFCLQLDVDNQPDNPFIQSRLIEGLKKYIIQVLKLETVGIKFKRETRDSYQQFLSNELFTEKIDRISHLISIVDQLEEVLSASGQSYPKLVIFLDQLERFGAGVLVTYLSEYLGYITSSKRIKFVVCARKETIKSAKQSVRGFFSTYFKRFVAIDPPQIARVLQKRLHAARGASVTLEEINKVFTPSFCGLIESINNNNLRVMLRFFEELMNTISVFEGREGYTKYFEFMLGSTYLDNLYRRVNGSDSIPLIKVTFDALQHYSFNDDKLTQVIKAKTLLKCRDVVGLTDDNIQLAVTYLLANDFISEDFDVDKKYQLTRKGEAYGDFMSTPGYVRIFAVTKNDQAFAKNAFTDSDFAKAR